MTEPPLHEPLERLNKEIGVDTLALDPAGSSRFSLVAPPALPFVVAPGDAVSVNVQFDPTANGFLRSSVIVRGSGQGAVVNVIGRTTAAAGMVAALFDLLGVGDPPQGARLDS